MLLVVSVASVDELKSNGVQGKYPYWTKQLACDIECRGTMNVQMKPLPYGDVCWLIEGHRPKRSTEWYSRGQKR
ncbi:hypothetical protein KCU95_g22, partial [Aureobasidium melanogenum]